MRFISVAFNIREAPRRNETEFSSLPFVYFNRFVDIFLKYLLVDVVT